MMTSRDLYLRLMFHVRPYWRQFAVGLVSMVLLALTAPAVPALMKPMLDGTFVEKDPDFIFWMPILLVLLATVRGILTFSSKLAFTWVSGKLVLDLRELLFDRLLTLPTSYYDANSTGNTISKVTHNVTQVTTAATEVLTILVKDSVTIVGLIAYLFYLNWQLSTLIFLLAPVVVTIVRVLARRMRRLSHLIQNSIGDMTHVLEETVRGHKIVKVFGGQAAEQKRFHKVANWVRRYQLKRKVAAGINTPVIEILTAMLMAAVIYIGTGQASSGEMTVGGFIAYVLAIAMLISPIKQLTGVNYPLQIGLAGAESIFALLDEPPEQDRGNTEIGRCQGKLELRNVSFRYPHANKDALSDISFSIEPGMTLALVGPSGGGKTTIASMIPRFYQPRDGCIFLDDTDIRDLTLKSLRKNLSYVGQETILFNDTVAANISFGADSEPDRDMLLAAAEAAHALEFIENLPEGFDTLIGEEGIRLSGGQRQRIAIARALLKDAPVLILDEATSSLDAKAERHVQAALTNLIKARTTLIIAHRLSTIERADLILVIKDGRIVETGTHESLLRESGIYLQLYQHHFSERSSAE